MKIYIAGAITGVADYIERFNSYREAMREIFPEDELICPHDFVAQKTGWISALLKCIEVLSGCDAIIMMPGWEGSRGANIEKQFALEMGIRVYDFSKGKIC